MTFPLLDRVGVTLGSLLLVLVIGDDVKRVVSTMAYLLASIRGAS
jgi:hypothetical protein